MSLLNELLEEEGTGDILRLLHSSALEIAGSTPPSARTIDLNRFEIQFDGERSIVIICDVLEEDESEEVSLRDFREALERAMAQSA